MKLNITYTEKAGFIASGESDETEQLQACPFCGCNDVIAKCESAAGCYTVSCQSCYASVSSARMAGVFAPYFADEVSLGLAHRQALDHAMQCWNSRADAQSDNDHLVDCIKAVLNWHKEKVEGLRLVLEHTDADLNFGENLIIKADSRDARLFRLGVSFALEQLEQLPIKLVGLQLDEVQS